MHPFRVALWAGLCFFAACSTPEPTDSGESIPAQNPAAAEETSSPSIDPESEPAPPGASVEKISPSPFWNAKTGGEIWSDPVSLTLPAETGDTRIAVFGSDDRHVHAVRSADGRRIWRARLKGKVRSTVQPSGDLVMVLDEASNLYALDLKHGEPRWQRSLGTPASAAMVADDRRLIHSAPDGSLVARRPTDGRRLWKSDPLASKPVPFLSLDSKRVYAVSAAGAVSALTLQGGRFLWKSELADVHSPAVPVESSEGSLLLVTGNGFLWCFDAVQGHELWRASTHEFVSASPVVARTDRGYRVLVAGGKTLFAFSIHGHELWRRPLQGAFRSGPILLKNTVGGDDADDDGPSRPTVAVGTGDHLLTVFDLEDGRELWHFETDGFISSAAGADGDRLLFGSVGGSLYGAVVTFPVTQPAKPTPPDIKVGPTFFDGDPKIAWHLPPKNLTFIGPKVVDDRVILSDSKALRAVALADGKSLWRTSVPRGLKAPVAPEISAASSYLITLDSRDRLRALRVSDGKKLWRSPSRPRARLPIRDLSLSPRHVLAGAADGEVVAFDPASGATLWRRPLQQPVIAGPLALPDGMVIAGNTAGRIFALDSDDGRERWTFEARGSLAAPPLLHDGVLFFADAAGTAYALDPAIGGERWSVPLGGSFRLPPSALYSTVFFCGDDGRLIAVDALSGLQSWTFEMGTSAVGTRCTSAPVIHNGIVYAGSSDRSLHAVNAINGEELWRLHTAAAVTGAAVGFSRDNTPLLVVGDRSGQVLAVRLP